MYIARLHGQLDPHQTLTRKLQFVQIYLRIVARAFFPTQKFMPTWSL